MPFRPYELYACGDNAITADFGNVIDANLNEYIITLFENLRDQPLAFREIVPAYSSITFYYDVAAVITNNNHVRTAFNEMSNTIHELLSHDYQGTRNKFRTIEIPVCYDIAFAPDAIRLAAEKNISTEELIRIHSEGKYRVYMLGFLPGFAYMGDVDEKIALPRKNKPIEVAAGSIGIADRQTGIYPFTSPGGWNIIGRTPLRMFDQSQQPPALLKPGDEIKFMPIDLNLFMQIYGDEYEGY